MKITNTSKAPQGVHTEAGHRFIKPGETVEVKLTEGGLKLAKRLKFLDFGKAKAEPEAEAAEAATKPAKA